MRLSEDFASLKGHIFLHTWYLFHYLLYQLGLKILREALKTALKHSVFHRAFRAISMLNSQLMGAESCIPGGCTKYLSTAFSSAGPDMSGEGWPCSGLQTAIQVTCARTPLIFHLTLHRVHNLLLPWLAICTAGTAPLPLSWSLSSDLLNIYCSGQKGFYFTCVQYLVGWSLGLHWDFWVLR